MKKPSSTIAADGRPCDVPDHASLKAMPLLMEMLTTDRWDDGTPRLPSAISLFIEDGRWKAAINDKDLRASLYVTADTLVGALKALESALASPSPDWRGWNKGKGKK